MSVGHRLEIHRADYDCEIQAVCSCGEFKRLFVFKFDGIQPPNTTQLFDDAHQWHQNHLRSLDRGLMI